MSRELSVTHKADRERMAAELVRTLPPGAALREPHDGREIVVRLETPCGAHCAVRFDGDSTQPGTWVVTWNTRRHMCPSMGAVNPYHGCKATRVFYSFGRLVDGLRSDVERFADGSAYACSLCAAGDVPVGGLHDDEFFTRCAG